MNGKDASGESPLKVIMKIIIVVDQISNGGAERVLSELANGWTDLGCEIMIVRIRPSEYEDTYQLPKECRIIQCKSSSSRFLRRFSNARDIRRILKNNPDAAVVSFIANAQLVVAMASLFLKNTIVFSERSNPWKFPPQKHYRKIRDIIYNFADCIVFQTADAKSYFSKRIQKKGYIIPNPVNKELPMPHKGKRRKAIAFVGRLTEAKNLPMLLDAYSMFSKEFTEYTLEIYGRGEMEDWLDKEIKKKNLQKQVLFMGYKEDIYRHIIDCAMYVSSSDYEGISNSMLEALALGIPSIVTDCPIGGARSVINSGVNGLLIPVGDANALCNSMKYIVTHNDEAAQMGYKASNIRSQYPLNRVAQMWLDAIQKCK